MSSEKKLTEENLMSLREVLARLNISKSSWYGGKKRNSRPKPICFGPKTLRWVPQEIEDYARRNHTGHNQPCA